MDLLWHNVGFKDDLKPYNKLSVAECYGERSAWVDAQLKRRYCPHVKYHNDWAEEQADRDFILRNIGLRDDGVLCRMTYACGCEAERMRNKILPKEFRAYPGHQPEFDLPLAKLQCSDRRSVTHRDYCNPVLQTYPGSEPELKNKDIGVQCLGSPDSVDSELAHGPGFDTDLVPWSPGCPVEIPEDRYPFSGTQRKSTPKMESVTRSDFSDPRSKIFPDDEIEVIPEKIPAHLKALPVAKRRLHKDLYNTEWVDYEGRDICAEDKTKCYCRAPFAKTLRTNFLSTTSEDFTDPQLLPGPCYVESELVKKDKVFG